MPIPPHPKLYHIAHVDRLASIVDSGAIWCDAEVMARNPSGTVIGMSSIKRRRLEELRLASHPGLFVGQCVPFYFCPRSIMLYLIYCRNSELTYTGGQDSIVHLEFDMRAVHDWAMQQQRRWAFTLSNAGSRYFEDRSDLADLQQIDWLAVNARQWSGAGVPRSVKDGKQAEFLVEHSVPWSLVERIGIPKPELAVTVDAALQRTNHKPVVQVIRSWYY